jgi:hypothetical protein
MLLFILPSRYFFHVDGWRGHNVTHPFVLHLIYYNPSSLLYFPKGNKIGLIITPTMVLTTSTVLLLTQTDTIWSIMYTHKTTCGRFFPRMGIITKCTSTNETLSEPFVCIYVYVCVCVFFKRKKNLEETQEVKNS